MIATVTIDTALRWIRENIFGQRCLADFFRDIFFARKRLVRGFVFYEFDPE